MNQRALNEMRHRTGMDRPALFYLWAVPLSLAALWLTLVTFRDGIGYLLDHREPFFVWVIAMMALVTLWRMRPRPK